MPFRHINDAAKIAQPGDEVLVSPGIYREYVNPVHAGTEDARICYRSVEPLGAVILGAQGDWEASDEVQAKFAAEEAAKVDAVWSDIFGSADNSITVPEDNSNNNGGFFDMTDDEGNNDPVLGG